MSDQIVHEIRNQLSALGNRIRDWRRHLHQNPELGMREKQTAAFIAAVLTELGLQPVTNIGGTGVYVDIGEGVSCIGWRSDMDALPIQETSGAPYASKKRGIMHACGHDAHTAINLGVAAVLARMQNRPQGRIRLIFQPAEELQPGGSLGMIADGVLQDVSHIFGLHVDPDIETGRIGVKYGPHLASVDTFEITVTGASGHAAYPHLAVDSVLAAARVIEALNTITSRRSSAVLPAVVTVTTVHGGEAKNVIPEQVTLQGTIRTLAKETREALPGLIRDTALHAARTVGATAKTRIQEGSAVLYNNEACARHIEQTSRKILGNDNTCVLPLPRLGAEDFANYLEYIPGAMFRLGTRRDEATGHSLHASDFNIDEDALAIGVEMAANLLISAMQNPPVTGNAGE